MLLAVKNQVKVTVLYTDWDSHRAEKLINLSVPWCLSTLIMSASSIQPCLSSYHHDLRVIARVHTVHFMNADSASRVITNANACTVHTMFLIHYPVQTRVRTIIVHCRCYMSQPPVCHKCRVWFHLVSTGCRAGLLHQPRRLRPQVGP